MRFVITGEWKRNQLLQTIIILFLVYAALLWVTNAMLYFSKMSLSSRSVVEYYLGSERHFTRPRSFGGMLEIAHFHLFAMGIMLLTLTHLMLFVPMAQRLKMWLVVTPFVSALADEGGGWLVRFVSPSFAYVKIGGFILLQTSFAALIAVSLWSVLAGAPNSYEPESLDDLADEDDSAT